MGRPKSWTDDEEQILLSDYFNLGAKGLSEKLNKSAHSILSKANRMGLKTKCNPVSRNKGKKHAAFNGYEDISGTYLHNIKHNAKLRNLEYSVTGEYLWFLYLRQSKKCALTDLPICFASSSTSSDGTASLDRIDSDEGYIEGNIQWIHKDINQMKWNFDQNDFISYCKLIATKSSSKPLPFMGSWNSESASRFSIPTVYGKI
jgi:hypothetical protein